MRSYDIFLRTISQEMPPPSITKIRLKITYMKFHLNVPGANELKTLKLGQVRVLMDNNSDLSNWIATTFYSCQNSTATMVNFVVTELKYSKLDFSPISRTSLGPRYNYCHIELSQDFQPMGAQLSLKAVLPLAGRMVTASGNCSNTRPSTHIYASVTRVIIGSINWLAPERSGSYFKSIPSSL